jgi:hypothetical protein
MWPVLSGVISDGRVGQNCFCRERRFPGVVRPNTLAADSLRRFGRYPRTNYHIASNVRPSFPIRIPSHFRAVQSVNAVCSWPPGTQLGP